MLQSIAGQIQDTLSNAERRARDVGYQLARNAETAMNGVTQQLEQLSVSAEEEGRKTQVTIERVRSELISEINASIGSAVDRFAGATEEMRKATRAVGRELEQIREDLNRGVLDLPEETSQHTAAMRRVVSEQIRALNELSEIVSRQLPGEAVSDMPVRAQASAAQAHRSLPVQKPSQPSEPRAFSRQPANQPPRPAVAERRQEPAARQPASEERSERSSGWISDLLRRVNDEDTPSPRLPSSDRNKGGNPLDGLGSLTSDIARSIDPESYTELWDRYRRGEGNVFTRRVYTLQGQQTFDEVRRRYGREADFREAVDRYIDHFSALYEEAVQKDPNGRLAENYLNSDTGKVYTLLAHASGKLG